jgi:nicotinamidase-related amidase
MALNLPSLYHSDTVYQAPYAARVDAFMRAGAAAELTPARADTTTTALILVDIQHDFVDPAGALSVPGAQDDVARLLGWLYANAGGVTRIYASLDTHLPLSIFYRAWWINPQSGERPAPYTAITVEDVASGAWAPVMEREWTERYLVQLRAQAKKDLMIWPEHTMEGTLGRMLAPALSEAIAWHSAARQVQPVYIAKGRTPRTEFYGIFGAEVPDPDDPSSALNIELLNEVMRHDRVYIAGEAKSHCVLETLCQIVAHYHNHPETLSKLYVLRDCMSSVAHPAIDFDALAEATFAEMRQTGVHFVNSAEPNA